MTERSEGDVSFLVPEILYFYFILSAAQTYAVHCTVLTVLSRVYQYSVPGQQFEGWESGRGWRSVGTPITRLYDRRTLEEGRGTAAYRRER
jgi:hypothetical protein